MSILIDKNTRVMVQGITGREGTFHTEQMLAYGTQVVAGVTPGKVGQNVHGVPVFDTVAAGIKETGANASIIFVPPKFAKGAVIEALEAKMPLIILITEGIPVQDMIEIHGRLQNSQSRLIGGNCPGVVTAGECKIGIMPGTIFKQGNVGLVARSGTLAYEVIFALTNAGMGQTTCVGIGGDPTPGTQFVDVLPLLEADPKTEKIVLIGEIGGTAEEEAAEYIKTMKKPVAAFISGKAAPEGKRMGHAGAIISGNMGTFASKVNALSAVGVKIADFPAQIPSLLK